MKKLTLPLSEETIKTLHVGDEVLLNGTLYTARDAAHERIYNILQKGETLPFSLERWAVYYAGPCPTPEGKIIGSIGPTTAGRMDKYNLIEQGVRVMVAKGPRNAEVIDLIRKHTAVYFATVGGAGALLSKCIKSCEIIAFDDLGTEAVRKLEIENFPVWVAVDCYGNSIYATH